MPSVWKFLDEPEVAAGECERPKYSKEAFVEALVEFIVGDDQVCANTVISLNQNFIIS